MEVGTVFYGPIYDQDGNLRVEAGANIPDDRLNTDMTWLVQGVEGEVREADEE